MGSRDEHRFDEHRFLGLGVAVCLFGALTPLIDLVLPDDSGALDIVGDLVSTFALYLYVGLAFGLIALRAGPLPKVAALLLLVDMLGPSVVVILAVPHGSEVLLVVHVLAILAFAAALISRRAPIDLALAASAVGGAVLLAWAGFEGDESLHSVGLIATGLGLAGLFHLGRRAGSCMDAQVDSAAWRRTDLGVRVFILGELGRLVLLAIVFVGTLFTRSVETRELMGWVVVSGHLVLIAIVTIGLFWMRDAPAGRSWFMAGLGLALIALGSSLFELVAMLLGLDASYVGVPMLGRHLAHVGLAAMAALGLGALGDRAGLEDARSEARAVAWSYLVLFVLGYASMIIRDFGLAKGVVGTILGLSVIVTMVVAVRRLRDLGDDVREVLPAGAAFEAFGGDEPQPPAEPREG